MVEKRRINLFDSSVDSRSETRIAQHASSACSIKKSEGSRLCVKMQHGMAKEKSSLIESFFPSSSSLFKYATSPRPKIWIRW